MFSKGIILDWDDTITDYNYWIRSKWLIVNQWVESNLGIKDFDATFWEIFNSKSLYYMYTVRDTLVKLNLSVNVYEPFIKTYASKIYAEDYIHHDAEWFLNNLKSNGWKIGIVTLGHLEVQQNRMINTNLFKYFDVIKYGDSCIGKPSMIPFIECAEELKLNHVPIVVGDDQRDMLAPYYIGMKCYMINHYSRVPIMINNDIEVVHSFKELYAKVSKL